jgi:hypothetical protein
MKKFIIEQLSIHRTVHVVEAENETDALKVAEAADDNWQEWLGTVKVDVNDYTDERIAYFKNKDYYWAGVSYKDSDGMLAYVHPSGERIERKEVRVG